LVLPAAGGSRSLEDSKIGGGSLSRLLLLLSSRRLDHLKDALSIRARVERTHNR
jgi:hypothetical protein